MALVKWKVQEPPTGSFRSFHKRGWPMGEINGEPAIQIVCDDDYVPRQVKIGNHAELTMLVADHRKTPWKWLKLKGQWKTLKEVKEAAEKFYKDCPAFIPN